MQRCAVRFEMDLPLVTFERSIELTAPRETLYRWHACKGAFGRLAPPWERVDLVEHIGGIEDGARVRLRLRAAGIPIDWRLEHSNHHVGEQFCDRQTAGPFRSWNHLHRFEEVDADRSRLIDRLEIGLPFGWIGHRFGRGHLLAQLERLFIFRHRVTSSDVRLLVEREKQNQPRLKILVTGATGLIGRHLVPLLTTQGHAVVTLGRQPDAGDSSAFYWDPDRGEIDERGLIGVDAVIHLAGSNLAAGRWTSARKREILESRTIGTRLLVQAMARTPKPIDTLVSSSAIGFYGDTGDTVAAEVSGPGEGFLADVCRAWEEEALPARSRGTRVVLMRTGVVLTPAGGALGALLPIFSKGAGGPVAGGRQWMSWISVDDLSAAFLHAIEHPEVDGPCNGVAPEAVRNREFTRVLGKVLKRPAVVPVPGSVLKLAYGQMARETILASCRVTPNRLLETDFGFRHPGLEDALRHMLGRAERSRHE